MSSDYRYELKFVLNRVQHSEFERWLWTSTLMRESYPARTVNSLYLDDTNLKGVRDNLAGLPDRSKYRIRWYGERENNQVADLKFEIKNRSGRLGSKITCPIDFTSNDFLYTPLSELMPVFSDTLHISHAKESIVSTQLFPCLFIQYERQYFEDSDGVRMTVDTDVRYRNVQLSDKLIGLDGIGNASVIAEIKFTLANKDKVSAMMANLHLIPQRHSKYLSGMAMAGVTSYI